jgi:hypothetical protein
MKCFLLLVVLFVAAAPLSRAEDLCESRDSIHNRVNYCDENWEFVAPANACVKEFNKLLSEEQPRLNKMLNAKIKGANEGAQNLNFETDVKVLADALDEVGYLIDFGKQVHTELEDYGASLVPPLFGDESPTPDQSDPAVRASFAQNECFGEADEELTNMKKALVPQIEQLEKTKQALVAMSGTTTQRDAHLNAIGAPVKVSAVSPKTAPRNVKTIPAGKSKTSESTITGKIDNGSNQK